jgi:hypothetical protein
MTSQESERLNELAQVALDGEMNMEQVRFAIKSGNMITANTHLQQALRVVERLLCELKE